jgi:hypothetical protein
MIATISSSKVNRERYGDYPRITPQSLCICAVILGQRWDGSPSAISGRPQHSRERRYGQGE